MAKQTGLAGHFYWSGVDLSGDIASADEISGGPKALDVTAIDKSAYERIGGLRDGKLTVTSFFNPAASASHPTFAALPTTDVIATYAQGGATGGASVSTVAKMMDYAGARKGDGMFTFKVNSEGNGFGLEWGDQLTAGKVTQGSAGALASLDYGATVGTTAFGLQAWLHVFAFTGTSVTVAVQHSDDDAAGDPYANVTGGVFTAATAVTSQRIATSATASIKRYLRINTTGTFSNAVFFVQVTKNLTATAF